MRFVRRPDVHHAHLECAVRLRPAFYLTLPFADGGPAIRPFPSSCLKTAYAGGR